MSQEKKLLVNVAARRLGVTDRRVRQLIQEGKLAHFKESERKTLVPEQSLEAYRHRDD